MHFLHFRLQSVHYLLPQAVQTMQLPIHCIVWLQLTLCFVQGEFVFVFALFGSSSLFVQSVFRARLVWTGGPLLLAILMSKTLTLLRKFVIKSQLFCFEITTFCKVSLQVGMGYFLPCRCCCCFREIERYFWSCGMHK